MATLDAFKQRPADAAGRQRRRGARPRHSRTSATSSISTCRPMRRTTSTASAAPAAPGLSGTAITIATPIDRKYVAQIEKLTGQAIQPLAVEATAERAAAVYGHHRDKPADGHGRGEGRERDRDRGRNRRNGASRRPERERDRRSKRRRLSRNNSRGGSADRRAGTTSRRPRAPPPQRAPAPRPSAAGGRAPSDARTADAQARTGERERRPSSASAITCRASSSVAPGRRRHSRRASCSGGSALAECSSDFFRRFWLLRAHGDSKRDPRPFDEFIGLVEQALRNAPIRHRGRLPAHARVDERARSLRRVGRSSSSRPPSGRGRRRRPRRTFAHP